MAHSWSGKHYRRKLGLGCWPVSWILSPVLNFSIDRVRSVLKWVIWKRGCYKVNAGWSGVCFFDFLYLHQVLASVCSTKSPTALNVRGWTGTLQMGETRLSWEGSGSTLSPISAPRSRWPPDKVLLLQLKGIGRPDVAQAVGVCGRYSEQEMMRFHIKSRTAVAAKQGPDLRLLSFALLFDPVFCRWSRIRVCLDKLNRMQQRCCFQCKFPGFPKRQHCPRRFPRYSQRWMDSGGHRGLSFFKKPREINAAEMRRVLTLWRQLSAPKEEINPC